MPSQGLQLANLLQADESFVPLCLRSLNKAFSSADLISREAALSTAKSLLTLRVMLCRSNGAVACLVDGASCSHISEEGLAFGPPSDSRGYSFDWWIGGADGNAPSLMYGVDDDDASCATPIEWRVSVKGSEDDPPFARCQICFSPPEGIDQLFTAGYLLSGLSTMKWVASPGAAVSATEAWSRQAAANGDMLIADFEDDANGDD